MSPCPRTLLLHLLPLAGFVHGAIFASSDGIQDNYDYIVVGGGTAGSVIASRLSEDPANKVLVLEAGSAQTDILETYLPFNCTFLFPDRPINWNFTTVPQQALGNRSLSYSKGHILGGSSAINYMLAERGASDDWDRYAEVTGDDGWSWDKMLPYFKKSEVWTEPKDNHDTSEQYDPSVHGSEGKVHFSLAGYPSGIDTMVINATKELKNDFPFNLDMNSGNELGVGWAQFTINKSNRSSASTAYLDDESLKSDNLDIVLNTEVLRLVETESEAYVPEFKTVVYKHGDDNKTISAKKEVIISAGSLNTPKLLMLSGIGARAELEEAGIQQTVDLPSVGKNLSDHIIVLNSWEVSDNNTRDDYYRNPALATKLNQEWLEDGTGKYLVATPNSQVGFFRLAESIGAFNGSSDPASGPTGPHFELIFGNSASYPIGDSYYMGIATVVVSPLSRGTVTLNTTQPLANPIIDTNFLAHDSDKIILVESIKHAKKFLTAPSFEGYVLGPVGGLEDANTDEEILAYAVQNAISNVHDCGTAGMSMKGADYGVVDPDLKLKKATGVRIVDASVFPFIPSAHTVWSVYALAERAADLIKATNSAD